MVRRDKKTMKFSAEKDFGEMILAWISTGHYLPKREGHCWSYRSGIRFGIVHS